MNPIQVLIPDAPAHGDIASYLVSIDRNKRHSNNGPLNAFLERRLAEALGVKPENVCTVANATLGLELAVRALGVTGCIVPAFTFPATVTAIVRSGGRPAFQDVHRTSWCMRVPEVIGFAAMPVCAFGAALNWKTWDAYSRREEAPVIIDAAAAFGNQEIGALREEGVCAVFSMHATKALPAGEGGFVVGHERLINRVRRKSNFGLDDGVCADIHSTNAKLSEYHAAVALASLDRWDETSAKRCKAAEWYANDLPPRVTQQNRPADDVRTIMPVLLPKRVSPAMVGDRLDTLGIETRRWYCPPMATGDQLPVTEEIASRLICLPFHTQLTRADVRRICSSLARVLR